MKMATRSAKKELSSEIERGFFFCGAGSRFGLHRVTVFKIRCLTREKSLKKKPSHVIIEVVKKRKGERHMGMTDEQFESFTRTLYRAVLKAETLKEAQYIIRDSVPEQQAVFIERRLAEEKASEQIRNTLMRKRAE